MPITEEIEAMAEVPLTVIDNWRDAWNFGIDDMISRAADLRTQFEWTGSDIVMGWSNTMSGLMQGTMKFRDFSRQMFMDVASSFMNMTARLAAQKLFDATVGKLQFSSGGGGSGFSYDAVKYRGAGRKVWAG